MGAITGTTSGLGYWAAVATVQKEPSSLIMLSRNPSRAVQADADMKNRHHLVSAYYLKSAPGSLGGNSFPAAGQRYHQSKLASIVYTMALHKKFASAPGFSNFKALSAAPGFSDTSLKVPVPKWIEHFIALSARRELLFADCHVCGLRSLRRFLRAQRASLRAAGKSHRSRHPVAGPLCFQS